MRKFGILWFRLFLLIQLVFFLQAPSDIPMFLAIDAAIIFGWRKLAAPRPIQITFARPGR